MSLMELMGNVGPFGMAVMVCLALLSIYSVGVILQKHRRYRAAARVGAAVAAVGTSTELFGWMQRHPDSPVARALAKPGHEFQHRVATAEPTPEQLEVAEAALAACLELENKEGERT